MLAAFTDDARCMSLKQVLKATTPGYAECWVEAIVQMCEQFHGMKAMQQHSQLLDRQSPIGHPSSNSMHLDMSERLGTRDSNEAHESGHAGGNGPSYMAETFGHDILLDTPIYESTHLQGDGPNTLDTSCSGASTLHQWTESPGVHNTPTPRSSNSNELQNLRRANKRMAEWIRTIEQELNKRNAELQDASQGRYNVRFTFTFAY